MGRNKKLNTMKIVIEDYNGNDMCELHINTFTDICEIDNLINCDIADVDEDDDGNEYLRIQLNEQNNYNHGNTRIKR